LLYVTLQARFNFRTLRAWRNIMYRRHIYIGNDTISTCTKRYCCL